MATPHLPPEQAANALLPELLRQGLKRAGYGARVIALEPSNKTIASGADVLYVPRTTNGWKHKLRLAQLRTAMAVLKQSTNVFRGIDVVHIHSNTFMNQVVAALAQRRGLPFVLTHYGTEIWHYRRRRPVDPFLWMNERAFGVTYYSRLLMERSVELGVAPGRRSVVYPPVAERFIVASKEGRDEARSKLRLGKGPVLLNVKRLHPLAGQAFLVKAMPHVLERHPDAKLLIAGEGESRLELEGLIEELDLDEHITLLGLVDNQTLPSIYGAADLFLLPSRLEAFPTVAAEALASGLPIVSADHPGGIELKELFPEDVKLVPKETVEPLAKAILETLEDRQGVSKKTLSRIEGEFRPEAALARYLKLYEQAIEYAHD